MRSTQIFFVKFFLDDTGVATLLLTIIPEREEKEESLSVLFSSNKGVEEKREDGGKTN